MPISKARFRISEYNEKRKKDVRGKERSIRQVSLSLTSMVDMFAILVIFLLTNSDAVSQIDLGHGIELPKAKYSAPPPRGPSLQVATDSVYADNKAIISIDAIVHGGETIPAVQDYLAAQLPKAKDAKDPREGYLNIVAHSKVPFGAVRKIIGTAQAAGYSSVNLAVQPKGG